MGATFDSDAIAAATAGEVVRAAGPGRITADRLRDPTGAWFVALAGEGFDDHAFLDDVVARGARGVVIEGGAAPEGAGVVRVADTWQALLDLGRAARRRFAGPVVALTGSTGKTTTRVLTALALSPLGEVYQTAANHNAEPGVPLTLLGCPGSARVQVLEIGTNRPGVVARLGGAVEPDVRVILNAGPAHLERLGDLDGVAREKGALFASARAGDVVVVPLDDPRISALPLPPGVRRVTVGPGGDVDLLDVVADADPLAIRARWRTPDGEVEARLPTPAPFVARNAATALAVAWALGVDLRVAAAALERYEPVGARLRIEALPSGAVALNDAYNANPDSMAAALRLLASLPGRRVAVLGDMLELGADEARYHAQVLALAGGLGLDRVVLVGPRMAAARGSLDAWTVDDPAEVGPLLAGDLGPGVHVLLKASRGLRLERAFEALRGQASRAPRPHRQRRASAPPTG